MSLKQHLYVHLVNARHKVHDERPEIKELHGDILRVEEFLHKLKGKYPHYMLMSIQSRINVIKKYLESA